MLKARLIHDNICMYGDGLTDGWCPCLFCTAMQSDQSLNTMSCSQDRLTELSQPLEVAGRQFPLHSLRGHTPRRQVSVGGDSTSPARISYSLLQTHALTLSFPYTSTDTAISIHINWLSFPYTSADTVIYIRINWHSFPIHINWHCHFHKQDLRKVCRITDTWTDWLKARV